MWLHVVLAILEMSVANSESLGPPRGSRGNIDFRYPDYIVQPLPPCPTVGVFPHPANCTWYYRCHTHVTAGQTFFRRSYYECEPGTSFSDALDQCIFPHDVGTCHPAEPCEDINKECKTYEVCYNFGVPENRYLCAKAFISCPSTRKVTPRCPEDQFYDPSRGQCLPDPSTARCRDCHPRDDGCNNRKVCNKEGLPETRVLCDQSYTCDPFNNLIPKCQHGELYDNNSKTCIVPSACKCEERYLGCQDYEVCDASKQPQTKYLCAEAYKCTQDLRVVLKCPPKMFYNIAEEKCVVNPALTKCIQCEPQFLDCGFHEVCINNGQPQNTYLCAQALTCNSATNDLVSECVSGSYYDKARGACVGTLANLQCVECKESYTGCEWYEVCQGAVQNQRQYLCDQAFKCVNNRPVPECQHGQFYDLLGLKCVSNPKNNRCSTVTDVFQNNVVHCTYDNLFPLETWMKQYCRQVELCSGESVTLCNNYYKCEEQVSGRLTAQKYQCPDNQVFSYNAIRCIPKPQDSEVCRVEFDLKKKL